MVNFIAFMAQIQAQGTPLLPDIGSIISVWALKIFEAISASVIAIGGRSLIEPAGLKYSILAKMLASTEYFSANLL
jgi:hypothetical protein|tara:strand:- start:793 stop:1020 length:228 start_codon:yes stop_codon:yes gene_type:complete